MTDLRIYKYVLLILCILFGLPCNAYDRSDNVKPKWMHSRPIPNNQSFVYVVENGMGQNLDEARQACFANMLTDAGFEKGMSVQSDMKNSESEHSVVINGNEHNHSESHFTANSVIKGKEVQLQGVKIDEYWEKRNDGMYYLTALYARSQVDGTPQFDNVKLTTKYGINDTWRSFIVPGWGQLYKGSTLKGGLIMGGTVTCIGAIIYTDCTRASFNSKIQKTHNTQLKLHYADQRTSYTTGRNICIGALCALYVYNIVDAFVAPGARHILTSPVGSNKFSYFWAPTFTDNMGIGVMASITF